MERPVVILNCATSHDGRLSAADRSPLRFSGPDDMARVHHLRAGCDGILVGIETILSDDPALTVKRELVADLDEVTDPVRIVLDSHGRIPTGARVLDGAAPTLVVTTQDAAPVPGAAQVRVAAHHDRIDLADALAALGRLGMESILVEGGERVLRSFLESGLWDRFTLYQAKDELGGDGPRLWDDGGPESLELDVAEQLPLDDGTLWTFNPR